MTTVQLRMGAVRELQEAQRLMESLINNTPSGNKRNDFTEANIHIMLALAAMSKAERS